MAETEWNNEIQSIAYHFRESLNPTKETNSIEYPYKNQWDIGDLDNEQFEKWAAREKEIEAYKKEELHKGFQMLEENLERLWW